MAIPLIFLASLFGLASTSNAQEKESQEKRLWLKPDPQAYAELFETTPSVKKIVDGINEKEPGKIASAIFYKLDSLGIHYIPDPEPYASKEWYSGWKEKLKRHDISEDGGDYVKNQDATLADKGGDCEDLAGLYATCLRAKGIKAGIVAVPRHMFALYTDSLGLHPVETTFIGKEGKSFDDAKLEGIFIVCDAKNPRIFYLNQEQNQTAGRIEPRK